MSSKDSTAPTRNGASVPATAWDRRPPAQSPVSRRVVAGFPPRAKLAERVAAEIETRIIRSRWPTGHVIGSEAELLESYGVSRAILREAIRILEHQSIAAMRKGPGGGLVVGEPSAAVVSRAIAVYFRHQQVSPAQLLDVRIAIETAMLQLVHARMSPALAAELRRHIETGEPGHNAHHSLHHFHLLLAKMSGNPGIELFVQCLVMLVDVQSSEAFPSPNQSAQKLHSGHEQVAEFLINGDLDGAIQAMARHIRSLEQNMVFTQ
jgi:DNA-binding FadR family transcriptional regulator